MPHMAGGYHYDFIPDVPLNYVCISCNFPLRKPHQISICGHRICLQCFQNIKQESEESNGELLCPFDDENVYGGKLYPDIAVEKELLNWNVKCVNHVNYCLWVGPLKELREHQVSCNKGNSENDLSEPEFITKADFEMVALKLQSLESRIEAYESKIVYYEQKMEISNAELASCKATLSEKCDQLTMIQSDLNMLKSLFVDKKDKCKENFGKFNVECETEENDTIINEISSAMNSNKLEQKISVNSTKSKDTDDMSIVFQDKSSNENKFSVTNREGKIEITDAANKNLNESSTINESDTNNYDNETNFNGILEKKSFEDKSEIHETIPKKPLTDGKENSTHGSNNMCKDVANDEETTMNSSNMSTNFNQIYVLKPKDILQWGKPNFTLLSPQFNHKDFCFQFKIKNTGDNIIFTFCHTKNQVLAGCKCTVLFLSKSGLKRPFKFDLSEAEEKSKTFPGIEFKKYFMDIETKMYIEFSA